MRFLYYLLHKFEFERSKIISGFRLVLFENLLTFPNQLQSVWQPFELVIWAWFSRFRTFRNFPGIIWLENFKARLQVHTQGFSQLEVDVTISHKTDIFCLSFSEKDLHVKLSWFYFSSGHWFLFIFCDFPIRKPIFWSSFLTDFRTKRMPRSGLRFFSKKEIHVDFLDRINRKNSKFCII